MTIVETISGPVRGVPSDRHLSFRGIPFAAPPVVDLRFRAPQPPEPWTEVRDGGRFAAAALQTREALDARGLALADEDCLYLNVTTPAADDTRRPVLLWIHGGGFTAGSGAAPSVYGGPLTEAGDVVVVTINYRLGAFGYLLVDDGDANAGQLDQIAALAWTRDNIARFGGDPGNVTVFGESAGAAAVAALLAMPAAQGLFHRAIIQSGTSNTAQKPENANLVTEALQQIVGAADPRALRRVDAGTLLAAQEQAVAAAAEIAQGRGGPRAGRWFPVVDGIHLPDNPLETVAAGRGANVPVIIGSNLDEQRLFTGGLPDRALDDAQLAARVAAALPVRDRGKAGLLIETYRSSRGARGMDAGPQAILSAIQGDARFRIPGIRLAEAQQPHQPATYSYLFRYASRAKPSYGACHALEIPFVFGNLGAAGLVRQLLTGSDDERTLSRRMMQGWLGFAAQGNADIPEVVGWQRYETSRRHTLLFDVDCRLESAPFDEERAAWGE